METVKIGWISSNFEWESVFNTPLECGLRSVTILAEAFPYQYDLQRLVQYDYLLVHSSDVPNGPASLHPATPHRAGEMLVRRPIIEQGIKLMMSKDLIECEFNSKGIRYFAGEWAIAFLGKLESDYILQLRSRAKWVVAAFAGYSDEKLNLFMRDNWDNWGAEFEFEALMRLDSK